MRHAGDPREEDFSVSTTVSDRTGGGLDGTSSITPDSGAPGGRRLGVHGPVHGANPLPVAL